MKKRIISMCLLVATLFSLLVTPAYAGYDTSAGGDGNFGEVGS